MGQDGDETFRIGTPSDDGMSGDRVTELGEEIKSRIQENEIDRRNN